MNIKKTYLCKDIKEYVLDENIPAGYKPAVGDVAVFEIIKIGKHRTVQSEWGRNMTIIPGDRIMAAFGHRYATGQFEGYVPEDVTGELHMLAAGGVAGIVKTMHYNLIDIGPTTLKMIGIAKDRSNNIINTKELKRADMIAFSGQEAAKTKVILSLGTSMDSGKTTTAAYLVNGIKRASHKVAFLKLTGTTYTKDSDLNLDLGADASTDFSSFGFPSTYLCEEKELFDLYESLLHKVNAVNPEYVVIEIADGLYEKETKALYKNKQFMSTVYGVIFSAGDSLSAIHGIHILRDNGIFPLALGGLFTSSPLLVKEVNEHKDFDIPILNIEELSERASEILKRGLRKTA